MGDVLNGVINSGATLHRLTRGPLETGSDGEGVVAGVVAVAPEFTAEEIAEAKARQRHEDGRTEQAKACTPNSATEPPKGGTPTASTEATGAVALQEAAAGGSGEVLWAVAPDGFTTANGLGHLAGQAVWFICNHEKGGKMEDLDRAIRVLQRLRELRGKSAAE